MLKHCTFSYGKVKASFIHSARRGNENVTKAIQT